MEKEKFGRVDTDTEKLLIDADLLILDDLGAEFESDFGNAAINEIVSDAILNGKAIIIISNLSVGQLEERYGQRVTSRLNGFEVIEFTGEDIRQLKK